MSQQALRRNLQELVVTIEDCVEIDAALVVKKVDANRILALLAAHKDAVRQLAACKRALRYERSIGVLLNSTARTIQKAGVKL